MFTRALKLLGLREVVLRLREERRRRIRLLVEARGSARLSRPALHGMDVALDAIIDCDGGVFVEAGGHDGYTQSNTYYLERFRGWRGLLVEPMPELAAQARRNRPRAVVFECALVPFDHPADSLEMEFGDLWSTAAGRAGAREWVRGGLVLGWRDQRTVRVPARPLSELIDEAGLASVDLLSLDVEGWEVQALMGLDLDRHAPRWILVEMHDLQAGRSAVGRVLGERYVEHCQLSPLDVLYRRGDVPAA
jgi:FkbM family methyltransferase